LLVTSKAGAKHGDQIYVTGPLGRSFESGHHLRFTPRIKESQYLVKNFKPSAMIDISDGLSTDLGHLVKQSEVVAILDAKRIPKRRRASLNKSLSDGEDFELLFTLSPSKANRLDQRKSQGMHFYRIGKIVKGKPRIRILMANGQLEDVKSSGYAHF